MRDVPSGPLTGLTFCGEGKYLATASTKGLEIFDASTGTSVAANYHRLYKSLRLADYGSELRGANDCGIRAVWKPELTETAGFSQHLISRMEMADALSPDGRFAMLGGSHRHEVLLELATHRMVARVRREERDGTTLVRFCPLGHRVALNNGDLIDVYDVGMLANEDEGEQSDGTTLIPRANGTQVAVAPRPQVVASPVFTLAPDKPEDIGSWYPPFALLGDGRGLLVKRPRNRIQWWDTPTGTVVNEWSWQFEWVTCVAASADGLTAVAGGRFGRVLLWDLG